MSYDPTLFKGTARYYSQYRLGYPTELYDEIFKHIRVGEPRLLDMGCGPATITNAIIDRCSGAVCVDPDPEMLAEGKRILQHNSKVEFIQSTAEDVNFSQLREFDLVIFGESLHWMNIRVLHSASRILKQTGLLVILYPNYSGKYLLRPDEPDTWQGQITLIIQKYLGSGRRAGNKNFSTLRKTDTATFPEILMQVPGLNHFIQIDISYTHTWTPDTLLGLLYSGSFCRRDYFADQIENFEADIRSTLKKFFAGQKSWTETYTATAYIGIKD